MDDKFSKLNIAEKLSRLSVGSLYDIKDVEIPEIEFLVQGIIARGQVHFFFGLGETLKTTLALYMAVSICSGVETSFGKVEKGNILWIDEEMGLQGLILKANMIAKSIGLEDDEWRKNFHYMSMTDFNIEEKGSKALVIAEINKNNIDAIFVDSLTAVTSGETDENARNVRLFNKLAYSHYVSILHIQHVAKVHLENNVLTKEAIRGSVDFGNQVDMSFGFVRIGSKDNKTRIRFKQCKGRHQRENDRLDINVEITDNEDSIDIDNLGDTKKVAAGGEDDTKFDKVLVMIKAHIGFGEMKTEDIISNVTKYDFCSRSLVEKVLKWAVKKKILKRVKNGVYKLA